ncbi:hypothetical protein KC217_23985, partial [Mycobacterium tuberculosis]|nr:hypothetical protein [Mycobacterium tuberculosis]
RIGTLQAHGIDTGVFPSSPDPIVKGFSRVHEFRRRYGRQLAYLPSLHAALALERPQDLRLGAVERRFVQGGLVHPGPE